MIFTATIEVFKTQFVFNGDSDSPASREQACC